jgi:hypothetical protein
MAGELPGCFVCPITAQAMVDPVMDPEGNSYERAAIHRWLARSATSPVTRAPLRLESLAPNRALRDAIGHHRGRDRSPSFRPRPFRVHVWIYRDVMAALARLARASAGVAMGLGFVIQALAWAPSGFGPVWAGAGKTLMEYTGAQDHELSAFRCFLFGVDWVLDPAVCGHDLHLRPWDGQTCADVRRATACDDAIRWTLRGQAALLLAAWLQALAFFAWVVALLALDSVAGVLLFRGLQAVCVWAGWVAESPLYTASNAGAADTVAELLRQGADAEDGMRPAVPLLLGGCALPMGATLFFSETPLFAAAERGDTAAVQALLDAGARPGVGRTLGPLGVFGWATPLSAALGVWVHDGACGGFSRRVPRPAPPPAAQAAAMRLLLRAGTATGASWGTGALVRITPLGDAAVVGTAGECGVFSC